MDLLALLPAFVVAVLLISASPGPAMILIFRQAAFRGWRAAGPTVLGLEAGLYLWALAAGAGLAALVAASEVAFVALRIVGAVFLVYLGVKTWHTVWRSRTDQGVAQADEEALPMSPMHQRGWWTTFGEGIVVMLANPKAAVFMIAFYPQFVPESRPLFATTALLAGLQVLIETAFYLTLAAAVGRTGAWFRRPRIRRRVDVISGGVLVTLGLRLATTTR